MYLHKLYEELGYSANNYPRWSKQFLAGYEEGINYSIERNLKGKRIYKLDDFLTLTALKNFTKDEARIWETAKACNTPIIVKIAKNTRDMQSFFVQLMRVINWSRDIPSNYFMPSEVSVSKQSMIDIGWIDDDYEISEEGHKHLRFRIITTARGVKYHVVIRDTSISLVKNKKLEEPHSEAVLFSQPVEIEQCDDL